MAADNEDVRRLRVPKHLWDAYTEITGDGGRSADLKAYIEWRVRNPTKPLPGEKFGPVKKVRASRATESSRATGSESPTE